MNPKSRNETSDNPPQRRSQRPKTENPVGNRILDALGDRDLVWLHEKAGIPLNTLRDYVRSGITRADNAERIAQALGLTLDWLLAGRGASATSAEPPPEDLVSIPMLDVTLSAGSGSLAAGAGKQAGWVFPRDWLRRSFGRIDGLHMLAVKGDSMVPTLHPNDWVMVDTSRTAPQDGIFAVRLDDELYVKRLQRLGRRLDLVSDNQAYRPVPIDPENQALDFQIMGRVVWSNHVHPEA
jgi:phage repressor protein C with HTH and peptisase S24 domain